MSGINKDLRTAKRLLKELGLNMQTALQALFAVHFTTTFDYPSGNTGDTIIVRASAINVGSRSIEFFFHIESAVAPTLDVYADSNSKGKSGMFPNDKLYIAGIRYDGKGRWALLGEFESDSPSLDQYYTTSDGNLTVHVLPNK